uniref:Uncharacterized protein n=1 Tax=Aegilops tauschii subsp. strangulata TaxID=200361 RepID=A0A453EWF4_AEGTS
MPSRVMGALSTKYLPCLFLQRVIKMVLLFLSTLLGLILGKTSFLSLVIPGTRRKKILFYPSRHQFSVSASGCQDAVPSITAKMGLYLEGSVSPATPDVRITILAAGNSKYAMLKKGDIATETKTNSDGSFFAGPLYEDIVYEVEASKAGYHLKQTGPYSFACQKLGQILVHIYGENDTEMLPAVLLSLSGEGGYRKNSVSGSGGTFSFDNLFPRSYYLRALLKRNINLLHQQLLLISILESLERLSSVQPVLPSVPWVLLHC